MNRHNWTQDQDLALIRVVDQFGCEDWTKNSQKLKEQCETASNNNRSGKQCRQRWYNHLSPDIKKSNWTDQQQIKLFQAQKIYGNKWKQICKELPGRTDNDVKNRFYSTLRRSLRRLNKYIGQKNSTSQMRQIKPSVLTSIIKFIYDGPEEQQDGFKGQLKQIPSLIFKFSTFKPVKNNMNTKIDSQVRDKISLILELVQKFKDSCTGRKKTTKSRNKQSNTREASLYAQAQEQVSIQEENSEYIRQEQSEHMVPSKVLGRRQISPIITIRKKSSTVMEELKKQENHHGETSQKIQDQHILPKIEEQIEQFPYPFNDQSNGSFVPYQDPSLSVHQNILELVVIGKRIEPVHEQVQGQAQVQENYIDQVFQQNYN